MHVNLSSLLTVFYSSLSWYRKCVGKFLLVCLPFLIFCGFVHSGMAHADRNTDCFVTPNQH